MAAVRDYHARVGLLLMFYIDGVNLLNVDDDTWEIYTLYASLSDVI